MPTGYPMMVILNQEATSAVVTARVARPVRRPSDGRDADRGLEGAWR